MAKSNNNSYSSLLRYITPSQVDDLILEEKLKQNGYKVSYIIDTYDLVNYCYPFGLTDREDGDEFRKELQLQDKLDEHITYDILIQNKENAFFLLDQHLDEFYNLQITIREQSILGLDIIDTHKLLLDEFKKTQPIEDKINLINKIDELDLSLIISIAIGYLRQGLEKIESIYKDEKRLIVNGFDKQIDKRIQKLSTLIGEIIPDKISNQLYQICEQIADITQKNIYKRFNKKNNYHNDCQVIDRIICANEILNKEKELILLLSSTPSTIKWFQTEHRKKVEDGKSVTKLFTNLNRILSSNLPKINGKVFNPHRSSAQIFLSFILDESSIVNKIRNLEKFRDSIAIEFDPAFKKIHEPLNGDWDIRIKRFREKTENLGMLSQLAKFKETLSLAKEKMNKQNHKKLYKSIEIILNEERELQNISKLRDFNFRLFLYENTFLNSIKIGSHQLEKFINKQTEARSIYGKRFNNGIFDLIKRGKDKVYGRYQILPVVFNIKNDSIKSLFKYYTNFLLSVDLEAKPDALFSFYEKWLRITLDFILKEEDGENVEMKILRCLILIFLPEVQNQEKVCLGRIDEILEFEISDKNKYLIPELCYIGTWVARRINDYGKALKYCKIGRKHAQDPRLDHSEALISYCMAALSTKKNERQELIEKTVAKAERAIIGYKELEQTMPVQKTIIAVTNTSVYSKCLLWEMKNDKSTNTDSLIDIRTQLVNEIKDVDENYYSLIELIHTEAYLEYIEYLQLKNTNKIDLAKTKILHAKNAIEKAISIDSSDLECLELQERIHKAVESVFPTSNSN